MATEEKNVPWDRVEREYRAGIRPLREIAADCGISEGAIRKRAKRDDWTRDLTKRIQSKAEEKVRKAQVRKSGTQTTLSTVTEKQVVEANSTILAEADLINRKDVLLALKVTRSQLEEVALLCEPEFRASLVWLGEIMDRAREGKPDKANELYQYIISLAGRVKMSKEIAASHGVYIPMQRRILKLDDDDNKSQTSVDALLAKINASAE